MATSSDAVRLAAAKQLRRADLLLGSRVSEFANSAYYMGSKRAIAPFIVEALRSVVPEGGRVLDLMCGSGSVAGACARFWPVLASDAQSFSRFLAVVQGGGFSRAEAASTLERVLPDAKENARELTCRVGDFIEAEDTLFHREIDTTLKDDYAEFVKSFPVYGCHGPVEGWEPDSEVALRSINNSKRPYMLFTAYFANIYFGLRQAVEIDSLRFGIDQLCEGPAKSWALGALIASASRVATTYAGHFAEPLVRDWQRLTVRQFADIIERRTASVFHEFSVRLMNLADESERTPHPVQVLPGPWESALSALESLRGSEATVVYLDPPYRREEYSRYYHALETLASYSYPTAEGSGRVPRKGGPERFRSEFFTRRPEHKLRAIVKVIERIISGGRICVWNYSDAADVGIPAVLNEILASGQASVTSFAAPHSHQTQGGRGRRPVTEYLLVIRPRR
jgi:adenine-specific DNA methylase